MNEPIPLPQLTPWQRFWHQPVRAERLAAVRILLGTAIVADLLLQYLPQLAYFYGPGGIAPAGMHDEWLLYSWRWTILLFNTDKLAVVWVLFGLRLAAAVGFLIGWRTRLMSVLLYLLTLAFMNRNLLIKNSGDDLMVIILFLMLFAPSGRALSVDSWRRRRTSAAGDQDKEFAPPWAVRLLQIQLCVIYLTTALSKLVGPDITTAGTRLLGPEPMLTTWWTGTSVHNALNLIYLNRFSFAQLALPFWLTATMTYVSVAWEFLFTPLVLFRSTRWLVLWLGVGFHVGFWLGLEVGWFSFYTLSLYGVWIPAQFWDWLWGKKTGKSAKSLE